MLAHYFLAAASRDLEAPSWSGTPICGAVRLLRRRALSVLLLVQPDGLTRFPPTRGPHDLSTLYSPLQSAIMTADLAIINMLLDLHSASFDVSMPAGRRGGSGGGAGGGGTAIHFAMRRGHHYHDDTTTQQLLLLLLNRHPSGFYRCRFSHAQRDGSDSVPAILGTRSGTTTAPRRGEASAACLDDGNGEEAEETPLHIAMQGLGSRLLSMVIEPMLQVIPEEAFLQPDRRRGRTPIHVAVITLDGGKSEVSSSHCADLLEIFRHLRRYVPRGFGIRDLEGRTPIYWAVVLNLERVLHVILERTIDGRGGGGAGGEGEDVIAGCLDVPDEDGDTPVHAAVVYGRLEMVRMMLQRHPLGFRRRNKEGSTPKELAAVRGPQSEMYLLLQ